MSSDTPPESFEENSDSGKQRQTMRNGYDGHQEWNNGAPPPAPALSNMLSQAQNGQRPPTIGKGRKRAGLHGNPNNVIKKKMEEGIHPVEKKPIPGEESKKDGLPNLCDIVEEIVYCEEDGKTENENGQQAQKEDVSVANGDRSIEKGTIEVEEEEEKEGEMGKDDSSMEGEDQMNGEAEESTDFRTESSEDDDEGKGQSSDDEDKGNETITQEVRESEGNEITQKRNEEDEEESLNRDRVTQSEEHENSIEKETRERIDIQLKRMKKEKEDEQVVVNQPGEDSEALNETLENQHYNSMVDSMNTTAEGGGLPPPLRSSTPKTQRVDEDNMEFQNEDDDDDDGPVADYDLNKIPPRKPRQEDKKKNGRQDGKKVIKNKGGKRRGSGKKDPNPADGSDEEQDDRDIRNKEEEIDQMLQAQMFTHIRINNSTITSMLAEQRSMVGDRFSDLMQNGYNNMVEEANEELVKAGTIRNQQRGVAGTLKAESNESKKAQEVVYRIEKSIESVNETAMAIHIDKIEWKESMHSISKKLVNSIKHKIMRGTIPATRMIIRGYRHLVEDGMERIFIHQGPEFVKAFRQLADRLEDLHPGEFETLEESPPQFNPLPKRLQNMSMSVQGSSPLTPVSTGRLSSSQPVTMTRRVPSIGTSLESDSQVVFNNSKKSNPFAYVLVHVLDKNNLDISDHNISLVKTMQKDEMENESSLSNRIKMMYMREVVYTRNLILKPLKQKYVNEKLKETLKYYNQTLSRSVLLDGPIFDMLISVMQMDPVFEGVEFVRVFMNARNTCTWSADDILRKVLKKEMKPDDALERLKDHPERVVYILMGKGVKQEDALAIEENLENCKQTVKTVKEMVGNNKKLKHKKLLDINYSPSGIMQIMARELKPCLAFTDTIIEHRMENDGVGIHKCVLAFIAFEDLKSKKEAFSMPLQHKGPTYLFVTDFPESVSDSNHLSEIFGEDYPGIGAYKHLVDCVPYEISGTDKCDVVECMVIGGQNGKAWKREVLRTAIAKFDIYNKIENHKLRQLMFNTHCINDQVPRAHLINSVFIHSPKSRAIQAIIANMAPYRVVISGTREEGIEFDGQLKIQLKERLQMKGTVFPPAPKKEKKLVDDGSQSGEEDGDGDGGEGDAGEEEERAQDVSAE